MNQTEMDAMIARQQARLASRVPEKKDEAPARPATPPGAEHLEIHADQLLALGTRLVELLRQGAGKITLGRDAAALCVGALTEAGRRLELGEICPYCLSAADTGGCFNEEFHLKEEGKIVQGT